MKKVFLGIILLSFLSCKKEGCKELNSLNFDDDATVNDGLCLYAYISSIQINQLPKKEANSEWDDFNVDLTQYPDDQLPDIQIRLAKSSESPFYYSPIYYNNKFYPVSSSLPITGSNYIELESLYTIEIIDKDNDGVETIYKSDFSYSQMKENRITLLSENVSITIILTEQ